jgi:hypothetical protein
MIGNLLPVRQPQEIAQRERVRATPRAYYQYRSSRGILVYTQWLNERGGIEADLTVSKLGEGEFMIATPCSRL